MDNLLNFFQKIELTAVPSILKKNLSAKKNSKVKLNPNTPTYFVRIADEVFNQKIQYCVLK